MPNGGTIVYSYDGSFDGLLCCVFDSYTRREDPLDILLWDDAQGTLYPVHAVATDRAHAQRVYRSLQKFGSDGKEMVEMGFLSGEADKEMAIYRFIRLAYQYGARAAQMLQHADTSRLYKIAQAVLHEQHLFCGFLRFSDFEGNLVATIEPKNWVLPVMQAHFISRYPEERFLIHDKTHGMALLYRPYQAQLLPIEALELPPADETELKYRQLWTRYYHTIAIESRTNPRCRMTHMPKRFWTHLTEMMPEEVPSARPLPGRAVQAELQGSMPVRLPPQRE